MRVLCVLAANNYGDANRGPSYEGANFVPALRNLGHDVHVFDSSSKSEYTDFAALNRALLNRVENWEPDLILAVPILYEIWTETWHIIRQTGRTALLHWASDDSWKYAQASRLIAPCFDTLATTYSDALDRYLRDGFDGAILTQWGASADLLASPLPSGACTHGVTFIGTAHGQRRAWIEELREAGVDVETFGFGWPAGPLSSDEVARVIRTSLVSINFANGATTWVKGRRQSILQIKARTFEVPGSGGFLLTQEAPGIDDLYDRRGEIDVFATPDELATRAKYWLAHPDERDELAQAGFARTRRDHTYESRFVVLLGAAMHRLDARRPSAAPRQPMNWPAFERAAVRHRTTPMLRIGARAALGFCNALWGPTKGPRVARRAAFEASWRLAGAKTYSASGIPGRVFYDQS